MDAYEKQVIRGHYMPHVDGIRALAVIAVMMYHYCSRTCPGGFSGVDVFFVISGFLIGGGILRDLREGSFSFSGFYTRRIKRIMPAYFAMISVSLIAGMILYHYEPLTSLGNGALRSSYFFSNFYFYKYLGDYFAGSADTHPLTNLWSLSVEEQFYIVIPFLMWAVWKLRSKALLLILGLLALLSFISSEHMLLSPAFRPHLKAFYMLPPRMWELMVGVLLAGLPLPSAATSGRRLYRGAAALLGLLSVLAGYIWLYKGCHFPGTGALPAVCGALLLIRYGNIGPIGWLLSNKLVVGVGRISYSLYLWHWPIIVFSRYIWGDELSAGTLLGAAALSVAMAYASWRWIEMPIRRSRSITPGKAFAGLGIACALIGVTGHVLKKTDGLVHVLHPEANRYNTLGYPGHFEPIQAGFHGLKQLSNLADEKGRLRQNTVSHLGNRQKKPHFVLLGDSQAQSLARGMDTVCTELDMPGLYIHAKSCPISGIEIVNSFSNILEPFLTWLKDAPDIDTVYILCRWNTRLNGSSQILYRQGQPVPPDSSHNTELFKEGLTTTCRRLREMGKEVVLFGPIPELRTSPGAVIRRNLILGLPISDLHDSRSLEEFLTHEKEVMQILKGLEDAGLARIVWIHPTLEQNGRFYGLMKDELLYHDPVHLSAEGARHVVRQLVPQLFPGVAEKQEAPAEQSREAGQQN